ncbi:glycoside hydrolase family 76 protein [Karstenula rhodostoma CBS 690.94]|uniref:Glycoside hydrolase family 76 protein n=1 Tax=Karstenula rhodostoma CBS 690.94 TaxID=1392251 RepID=A0A9P4PE93_9PLEO|nr:glycoside hydrolase family 76 protein [Karstenula rhodostoma CBS 690.94]
MLIQGFVNLLLLAGSTAPVNSATIPRDASEDKLEAAYGALQQWYNHSNGLWIPSTGWWNSANCLTVITGVATVDTRIKQQIEDVITETFVKAPHYSPEMAKVMGTGNERYLMQTVYGDQWPYPPPAYLQQHGRPQRHTFKNFLNDYYDDEGWWALGWIAAYDLTHDRRYLRQAGIIFEDMYSVFGKTNCSKNSGGIGGIWWDKSHTYVNAIANELFFSTAASLANRAKRSSSGPTYLDIAKQQLAWFKGTGMIGDNFAINDGLVQQTCNNNGGTIWTYNQGVILGGLVELSKATHDNSYVELAHNIANAAIATLAPDGILKDPCEPNCGADGAQFKGIFVRNLLILHKINPRDIYRDFFKRNARSIWDHDRNRRNELSISWTGPFVSPANASTQSSAMDSLVAAVVVGGPY